MALEEKNALCTDHTPSFCPLASLSYPSVVVPMRSCPQGSGIRTLGPQLVFAGWEGLGGSALLEEV